MRALLLLTVSLLFVINVCYAENILSGHIDPPSHATSQVNLGSSSTKLQEVWESLDEVGVLISVFNSPAFTQVMYKVW